MKLGNWLMTNLEQYFASAMLINTVLPVRWQGVPCFGSSLSGCSLLLCKYLGTFIQRYCLGAQLPNQNWAHIFLFIYFYHVLSMSVARSMLHNTVPSEHWHDHAPLIFSVVTDSLAIAHSLRFPQSFVCDMASYKPCPCKKIDGHHC